MSPDLKRQVKLFDNINKNVDRFSRPAMNNSVKIMLTGWRDIAAVDTGLYKNTLKTEVKTIASGRILQGAVRTFVASRTGFPYPRALENSTRTLGADHEMTIVIRTTLEQLKSDANDG